MFQRRQCTLLETPIVSGLNDELDLGRDLTSISDTDQWFGVIYKFPTVLHARASFSFDINPGSLQKTLVHVLSSLRDSPISMEITVANLDGYSLGRVDFKIGVGNGEGFDILDDSEVERILDRIENRGSFDTLDLAFHLHYVIEDGRSHKVHEDHYIMRFAFRPGRVELLVHHLKGMRRVDSVELVRLLLRQLNTELSRMRLPEVESEEISST